MNIREKYPYEVITHENIYITLPDTTQIASKLWMPHCKNPSETFPTILEYIPYGKNTGTVVRDHLTHPYFSGYGYVCLRVDMRGYGESQGSQYDEYVKQEQDDCIEIINWILKQPWSNQNVGMMGISWGGFNSLQVAYRKPKGLKAIITLCSTDDRYLDDIHYKGGALLCENIGWAATMLSFSSSLPDPKYVKNWEEIWLKRLKNIPNFIETWLLHQERDDYWKHGSICEDYDKIEIPVYTIGGWNDAYKNPIFRMFKNLKVPCKALVGPWCHKYPHFAVPTPAIGFLQEALKFWNHWLKDEKSNIMEENKIVAFIEESYKPKPSYNSMGGFWISEQSLDSENFLKKRLFLSKDSKLSKDFSKENSQISIKSPLNTGKSSGEYCIIWLGPEYPVDQREDDSYSLVFDSEILEENISLLGTPKIQLYVSSDKPFGQVIVRLNEIHADTGEITRISYGILNLEFLSGFHKAIPLEVNKIYKIAINLDNVGYQVKKGNKLRVSISNSYFPFIFPCKELNTLTIALYNECFIDLPIYKGKAIKCPFEEPEANKPLEVQYIQKGRNIRDVIEDVKNQTITTKIEDDFGLCKFPNGMIVGRKCNEKYFAKKNDALSAKIEIIWEYCAERQEMDIKVDVINELIVECDYDNFYIKTKIFAKKNGIEVYKNEDNKKVLRISV